VLLHGYGGFGLSSTAAYSELAVAWAALGGRYVVAGLRGGRERGADWHAQGRLDRRQRVFDDFADVADALVDGGLCTRDQLAIWGSSNGGLLIAATLAQRPDLCAAAHAAVPMTDMLGYHRLSIARLWMGDFGDPDDPEDRAWLRAASPLHILGPAPEAFPDVIVTTGRQDTRVDPFHSYAFVEALRARRDPHAPELLLLGEDLEGGHGIGKPADRFVEERADVFAVLLTAFARRAGADDRSAHTDSDSL
jgi:prolyl oligopeptidase